MRQPGRAGRAAHRLEPTGRVVALAAAASQISNDKDLISGCVLLNAQCKFLHDCIERPRPPRVRGDACKTHDMLGYLKGMFVLAKPHQLWSRLREVFYAQTPALADDNLVESIREQMEHPESETVWNRMLEAAVRGGPKAVTDDQLEALTVPLLLLWGAKVSLFWDFLF